MTQVFKLWNYNARDRRVVMLWYHSFYKYTMFFYNKDHKGQHFCLDTGTALSSWYLAVDGYFFINADLWNRQSQNFQLFVMRFASEVGLCHNCVIELYITEFTSRNALVWKQLVSYLCLLTFRLWPSFLRTLLHWNCRFSRLIRTWSRSRSRSLSKSTDISWLFAYSSFPRRRQSFIWGGSFSDEILIIITTSLSVWGRNPFHSQLRKATLLSPWLLNQMGVGNLPGWDW